MGGASNQDSHQAERCEAHLKSSYSGNRQESPEIKPGTQSEFNRDTVLKYKDKFTPIWLNVSQKSKHF